MDDLETRLIERKFGLTGCTIWDRLQLIVAENMEADISEWGYVPAGETMESLAKRIRCTVEQFEEFVKFCDDNLILEKRDGRLFCQYVLDRKNEYARKIEKKGKEEKADNPEKQKQGNIGLSEKTEIPKNPRNNTTQHNTSQTQHREFLVSGDKRPVSDTGFSSVGEMLKSRKVTDDPEDPPPQSPGGISRAWQAKAFEHFAKMGVVIDRKDLPRIMRSYKEEAEGVKAEASTDRIFGYLTDYAKWKGLSYKAKLDYWFWLRAHGIKTFEEFGGENE